MQRLDRILSEAGVASRKELKTLLRQGRICVNGSVVTKGEEKYDEKSVSITLDGQPVLLQRPVLLMLNKPSGFVTSTDEPGSRTVMELIPEQYRRLGVLPVGRLDKDTEGLLLFTNDGQLAHRLISPKSDIWKTYYAEHEGQVTDEDIAAFREGLTLADGTKCLPAELLPQEPGKSIVRICEGKYHQVRRMMAARNMPVTYLKRLQFGEYSLDSLVLGGISELSFPSEG